MTVRFGNIRRAIKDGLTGADLTAYKSFRRGDTKLDIKNVKRGPSARKIVSPFFLEGYNNFIGIKISGRAIAAIGTVGVTDTQLGLLDVPSPIPAGTAIRKLRRYAPARLICFVPTAGGVSTTPKSQITGSEYNKIPGESYTLPFGKRDVAGFRNWLEITASIEGTVAAGVRVSFKTENF
jgi:hypothetical protein